MAVLLCIQLVRAQMVLLRESGVERHALNPQNSVAIPPVQLRRRPGIHAKALIGGCTLKQKG